MGRRQGADKPTTRQLLDMRAEGLSYVSIAHILGRAESTVYKWIQRIPAAEKRAYQAMIEHRAQRTEFAMLLLLMQNAALREQAKAAESALCALYEEREAA